MITLRKTAFYLLIALLTVILLGCGEPAADQEEVKEEELQEEIEENDEEENNLEEDENDNNADHGSGTSGSSFSHTVDIKVNGEIKEGEGEEWWDDEEGGSDDKWWDD